MLNLIIAGLLYLLALFISQSFTVYNIPPWWWPAIPIAIFTNALGAFFSLIPFPYESEKGMPNDGRYILQLTINPNRYSENTD